MKSRLKYILVLVIIFMPITSVDATSGKLKSSSITTCNGSTYGHHGDGHWHYAAKRTSGWYPQGGSLGYASPCAAPTKQNENRNTNTNKNRKNLQQDEAKSNTDHLKQEQEEKDRLEKEKKEKERIEKERIEKERLEKEKKEKERLMNAYVKSISYKDLKVSTNAPNLIIENIDDLDLRNVEVVPENNGATVKIDFDEPLKAFHENNINIKVESEDKSNIQEYLIPIYPLGNIDELKMKKMNVQIGGKSFEVQPDQNRTYTKEEIELISKNDKMLLRIDNTDIGIFDYKLNSNSFTMDLNENELEFMIDKETSVVTSILGLAGGGLATVTIVNQVKKKKHKQ